jgi:hypothetical protein
MEKYPRYHRAWKNQRRIEAIARFRWRQKYPKRSAING